MSGCVIVDFFGDYCNESTVDQCNSILYIGSAALGNKFDPDAFDYFCR